MGKLVLFDGNAIMHRAFHALPDLTTRRGEPINAVYGLVSMLLRVIQDLTPTHLVFCFDRKEKTFRKVKYVEYQAHRPSMDTGLSSQFEKAYFFLDCARIPVFSVAGYEADDVIGTIATQATGNGKWPDVNEVVVVTGDRDILQLVNDRVKVYMPVKGVNEGKLYGEAEVIERMGVAPSQIVDYKALVGDPSDNYPGVAGIGPKTAIHLLDHYKNKNNIYQNLDKISPRVAEKLEKGKAGAEISYELAKIVTDIELDLDLNLASHWDIDSAEVLTLFEEFGFKTLTQRVKEVGKKIDIQNQGTLF